VQARLDGQRAGLVAAATTQLAEQGYAGCSVAAVSRRAGVAAGTVYNHFAGKDELVSEVFRAVVGREVAAVRDSVANATGTASAVIAFVETFARRALRSPRLAHALLVEPVDTTVDALRLEFRIAFRDIAAGVVRDGIAAGELPDQNPALVAAALVGAIGEALVGPLGGLTAGAPHTDLVPELIAFALRSLGVLGVSHAVHA
jgi:AcrR family transcriptional regulator